MKLNAEMQSSIRRYLLGQSDEGGREAVETKILTDDELFEEVQALEDELIDDYLNEKLNPEDRLDFERFFLTVPEKVEQIRFGRVLGRYLTEHSTEASEAKTTPTPWWQGFTSLYSSPLNVAVCAAVVVAVVSLGIWQVFLRQSEVEKGLVALNEAYRLQRPIEARISNLDYAPYVTTRGAENDKVDQNELSRAEITLLDALKKNPSPAVSHALGKVYLSKREFDRAIEQFTIAVKNDPNNPQLYADLGAAWFEKGKLNRSGSDQGKAMEELGRGLENVSKALQLNPRLPEALFNRALCQEQMMLYSQAEDDWRGFLEQDSTSPWADEARRRLQLLEEQKKRKAQTKEQLYGNFLAAFEAKNSDAAWMALSNSRNRDGNSIVESLLDEYLVSAGENRVEEAAATLKKLAYAGDVEIEKVGDTFTRDLVRGYTITSVVHREGNTRARQLIRRGAEHYAKSEFDTAIELFSEASKNFEKTRNKSAQLFAESWVGYCYLRHQKPDEALTKFDHLEQTFSTKNYKSMLAQAIMAQADALSSKNEYSKVLERANKSLELSEQIGDTATAVRSLQSETLTQALFGNYNEALRAITQALNLAQQLPPDVKIIWTFYNEACFAYYFLGLPNSALLVETEALRMAQTAGLPLQTSRSHDRLAVILEQLGLYSDAMQNAEQARAVATNIKDERTRTNVLAHSAMVLGKLYRETGDPKQALASYDTALSLYKQLGMDIYQYPNHKGKLLALIQLNDDNAAQVELETMLYWFEQNRQKITEASFKDKFFDTEGDTYQLAIDFAYSRLKDANRALEYSETSRARSLYDFMRKGAELEADKEKFLKLYSPSPPLMVQEIQQKLAEQVQLLEFSVLPERTIIWVITRNSIKSLSSTIAGDVLNQKIQDYLRLLSRGSPDVAQVDRQSQELYRDLIKPAASFLNPNLQLCIIPDYKLNFVPFAALMSPDTGKYLIEEYTLQVAPSASVFITSTENAKLRQAPGPERTLVVGNPSFDRTQFGDLPDLPSSKREAEEIAAIYGTTALTENTAVLGRVRDALKAADVVHLATHAIPDDESPLKSKLLLASNGDEMNHAARPYITAADIYQMKLTQTRLAVLSACQTGIERAYRGEGAIGLARPFVAVGVPLVVASLWPVESNSTADLMISFHKHRIRDPVSTIEALRLAQLEAIQKAKSNRQRNYEWAAFVVIGGHAAF